jgi:5-methylcytosine-specific restriction enzyme A
MGKDGLMRILTKTKRFTYRNRQKARQAKLLANPLCEHCEARGLVVIATEVDHIIPLFKGGEESLDPTVNKQSLCSECHKIKTSKDMGHKVAYGCDANGIPLDPNHHWNKL